MVSSSLVNLPLDDITLVEQLISYEYFVSDVVHEGIKCNSCQQTIIGIRYKCGYEKFLLSINKKKNLIMLDICVVLL